ncbi:MAG: type II secretion system F family protein [Candidatus Pacebacteria bacterium]|jgi:type IV pilus assembly protein PilC|nr:type II secretion system F family protein [Candidatus Paceibacterota bacterium]
MKFNYQARTKDGQVKTGSIEAGSAQSAAEILRRDGFFVTFLGGEREKISQKMHFFEGVSGKEVAVFSRQLAVMFAANVSLIEALRTIGGQLSNQAFREKILKISQIVEAGSPLSAALARYSDIFSPFFIAMVRAGEVSGNLSEQFNYLADYLEKQYYLAGKIKGALIYPAVILVVMISVLFLLSYFVMPNLVSMLTGMSVELPPLTKFVINFTNFIRGIGGIILLLSMIGVVVIIMRFSRTRTGKQFFDELVLRIPAVRDLLKMLYISRFADNLSTLITGGIPITQALEITGTIVGNNVYRDVILKTCDGVRKGQTVSAVLFGYPELFPVMFSQMILVGEQTGSLDKSLKVMVAFYEKETERAIDSMLILIEPVMILVLGLIVGGVVASVMIPLYQSMGNV